MFIKQKILNKTIKIPVIKADRKSKEEETLQKE